MYSVAKARFAGYGDLHGSKGSNQQVCVHSDCQNHCVVICYALHTNISLSKFIIDNPNLIPKILCGCLLHFRD